MPSSAGEIAALGWRAALFAIATTGSALAGPELDFAAPSGCPGAGWFDDELVRQGIAPNERGRLSIVVSWVDAHSSGETPSRGSYAGSARYRLAQGAEFVRELEGANCGELLTALAVSLSLHLEPTGGEAPTATTAVAAPPATAWEAPTVGPPNADQEGEAEQALRRRIDPGLDAAPAWRFGLGVSGAARGGLDLGVSLAPSLGLLVRANRSGWGSGPFALMATVTPTVEAEHRDPDTAQSVRWNRSYWTLGALVTPGTFELASLVRVGPKFTFHAGSYTWGANGVSHDSPVLFSELLLHADARLGDWLLDGQLGLQLPVGRFAVSEGGQSLHRQAPGAVIGLGAAWLGVIL